MQGKQLAEAAELGISSIILTAGLALTSIMAIRRNFSGVFIGVLLSLIGYKLSQYSARDTTNSLIADIHTETLEAGSFLQLLTVLTGAGTMTYGTIILISSLNNPQLFDAVGGTLLLFTGYALSHYAINKTLI